MQDFFNFPDPYLQDYWEFSPLNTGTGASSWQKWEKPRGKSMCFIWALGGGAGGGGGFTGTAGTGRGGGGGGGSGACSRLIIPIFMLPDALYIQPGSGGLGSTGSGVAGGAGARSFVCLGPFPLGTVSDITAASNSYLISGNAAATGGGAGTAAAGGAAGASETLATAANAGRGAHAAFWFANVGMAGAAGGDDSGAVGASINMALATIPVSGGAGGGGTTSANFSGGAITGDGRMPTIAGGATGAINGGGGGTLRNPFMACGGSGGAGINTTPGGAGGRGGAGSGGGGGGGGTTGGIGGHGGNGLVIICCW
jgi:hypothetical protein